MKTQGWFATIVGAVLLVVILLLPSLLRNSPVGVSRQNEQPPTAPSATQSVDNEAAITWVPTNGPEGEEPPWPTETLAPTYTPLPTPTPRAGPTSTPFPTQAPGANPQGEILFISNTEKGISQVSIDEQGLSKNEPSSISIPIDFKPYSVAPSPDGKYLLLMQQSEPGGIPYIFNMQTQDFFPVFKDNPHTSGEFFGWYPDSRQILFWRLDSGFWLINIETGEFTTLSLVEGPIQGATLSPDGQKVIYIGASNLSYQSVWRTSTAGGDAEVLPNIEAGYVFGWSPNGKQILFMGGRGVDQSPASEDASSLGPLWLLDSEMMTSTPLKAPFISGSGFKPVWSPDGQWIAFTGFTDGENYGCAQKDPPPVWPDCLFVGTTIYVVNVQSGELRALAKGIEPVWSPDGSMLAFISNSSGSQDAWTTNLDGSNVHPLTHGANIIDLAWMRGSQGEVKQ